MQLKPIPVLFATKKENLDVDNQMRTHGPASIYRAGAATDLGCKPINRRLNYAPHTGTSPQFLENLISTIRNVAALHQQFLVYLLLFLFIGRHRAPVRPAPLDKHGDSF